MSECTCSERPVLNCLVHYDRTMAHRVLVKRVATLRAELEAENAKLQAELDALKERCELLYCAGAEECPMEQQLAELREALQKIADGENNLGWSPCSYTAKQALLKPSSLLGSSSWLAELQAERDALLIIASKYCPKDHPVDWKKILEIARDK